MSAGSNNSRPQFKVDQFRYEDPQKARTSSSEETEEKYEGKKEELEEMCEKVFNRKPDCHTRTTGTKLKNLTSFLVCLVMVFLAYYCWTPQKPVELTEEMKQRLAEAELTKPLSMLSAAKSSSEQQAAKPGEVPMDVFNGTKLKALTSFLVCLVVVVLAYYCWTPQKPVELTEEMKQLLAQAKLTEYMKQLSAKTELKKLQLCEVDVTLDPDTAHPRLVLSDDGKQVHYSDEWKNALKIVWKTVWTNPERFSDCVSVLGSQSFSSGRFYFEVQVKGKTNWVLGVARESINRKGDITLSPRHGYWTVRLRNGNEYEALDNPSVRLHLQSVPEKVGVFVDYEEGLVYFCDVDAAALIYSFTGCSFTEKLYPFFSPGDYDDEDEDGGDNNRGKNSAPLIICPVKKNNLMVSQINSINIEHLCR